MLYIHPERRIQIPWYGTLPVPESMLAAAGDVLPLLIGQLVCRVHGLFLAGVEEARTVWEEDASGQRLKHPPQGIARRQRASCKANYIGWAAI